MSKSNQVNKGWQVNVHVMPIDDIIFHEGNSSCICGPTFEEYNEGGLMYVHHSLDNREKNE